MSADLLEMLATHDALSHLASNVTYRCINHGPDLTEVWVIEAYRHYPAVRVCRPPHGGLWFFQVGTNVVGYASEQKVEAALLKFQRNRQEPRLTWRGRI